MAVFDAVLIGAGLLLLGVPLALTLAALQFLACYVPTGGRRPRSAAGHEVWTRHGARPIAG